MLLIALMLISIQPLNAAKSCEYRLFDIKTLEKVTSIDLLTQLADSCDFSIIIKDDIASKHIQKELYGINIKNLSLDEIFEVLISDNDLYYEYDKNFLKISAIKTKTFVLDYVTSIRNGTANLNASVDATITEGDTGKSAEGNGDNTINSTEIFDFWSTVLSETSAIMNTGAENYQAQLPIVNSNAGLITVTGTKTQLKRVEDYLKILEINLHKQVLIDVSIIGVQLREDKQTGIDWSGFSLSLKHDTTVDREYEKDFMNSFIAANTGSVNLISKAVFSMEGLMDFVNTQGKATVISSPKVLSMNNQQALITIGDNINYRVKSSDNSSDNTGTVTESYDNFSIFIGVLLNITPEVTQDNNVILRINPSVSNFKYPEDDGKQIRPREIAPDTSEKKLSTIVKVADGNTIILGGLITHGKSSDRSDVSFLSEIPILGEAFKYDGSKNLTKELIFVITPSIIGPRNNTKATLSNLGFSESINDK